MQSINVFLYQFFNVSDKYGGESEKGLILSGFGGTCDTLVTLHSVCVRDNESGSIVEMIML